VTPPTEEISFAWDAAEAPYHVGIKHVSGPEAPLDVTLFSARSNLDSPYRVPAASFCDPAAAHGAFTTGAVDRHDWDDPDAPLESFSSRGPTTDGRIKPDVVGPNRTSTVAGSPSGTSYVAPVVAGAAALLLQQDPNQTPLELAAQLRLLALDINPVGPDPEFGQGQVEVDFLPVLQNSDSDPLPDIWDNCPYADNPGQEDVAGVGGPGADGIGDACQCGDATGDGGVDSGDVLGIRGSLAQLGGGLGAPALCNVIGPADAGISDCGLDDLVVIRRRLAALAPAIQPVCAPAVP
jgi:subtilisin family serine protease